MLKAPDTQQNLLSSLNRRINSFRYAKQWKKGHKNIQNIVRICSSDDVKIKIKEGKPKVKKIFLKMTNKTYAVAHIHNIIMV